MSEGYSFRNYYIPERMMEALQLWIDHGIPPGGFLEAVLRNDLSEACGRADEENLANLPAYAAFLYNNAPPACHGSPQNVGAWAEKHQAKRSNEAPAT